ncbi:MAG: hypothetical protein IPK82_17610 [Polyangiaceae bacterium]|nr:hypothetical protein [Polyangiaceae bacterium]
MATKTLVSSPSSKVSASAKAPAKESFSEVLLSNEAVSLCLLVNRRQGNLRVIDFRAGPTPAKRSQILATARREGVEKVYTLVERDEVVTWAKMGFVREGSIPGFYRRSDAAVMGIVVSTARPLSPLVSLGPDADDDDYADEVPVTAAWALSERTITRAKKFVKDVDLELPSVKLAKVSEADAKKAVSAAHKKGGALTGFEPFGRDAQRSTYACATRGNTLYVSVEAQPFFHNSLLELLSAPKNDAERLSATAAVAAITERLRAEGASASFAVGPADDALLAATFMANGFRRSAALSQHVVVDGERKDAVVWSKKLTLAD